MLPGQREAELWSHSCQHLHHLHQTGSDVISQKSEPKHAQEMMFKSELPHQTAGHVTMEWQPFWKGQVERLHSRLSDLWLRFLHKFIFGAK